MAMTTGKDKQQKDRPTSRPGDLDIERRARNPTKGLRLRFRTALRMAGVTGKFRTDEHRDGSLIVLGRDTHIELPFSEFEGHPVRSLKPFRAV
jgi:hypothetical protein